MPTVARRPRGMQPKGEFRRHMRRGVGIGAGIVSFSLALATLGYHTLGALGWVDALLNAAMILTGMGPVSPLRTASAKLFATFYALYSGIAFLSMVAVVFAPL